MPLFQGLSLDGDRPSSWKEMENGGVAAIGCDTTENSATGVVRQVSRDMGMCFGRVTKFLT